MCVELSIAPWESVLCVGVCVCACVCWCVCVCVCVKAQSEQKHNPHTHTHTHTHTHMPQSSIVSKSVFLELSDPLSDRQDQW